ncbi:polysaccharide biosynthesis protein [Microbacterium sp. CFBP9034]|uniref:lipopolysaccharide biosynthesis protein n=1 Tax=Microbacterium sp. CFBP9034 TaxID=3096540 RepID=UPI002A6A7217|nr:polysaccharide biosynthesis protein [Microbacterium sp. CFBP9034]MDY0908993.1 polysaccharide biosynthesis protein [Microbacterium sp. CFBP9034]
MRSLMLRLAGFTGAPILSALAPFIILPVVSRVVGDDGWANFSAGQSIGILGMVGVLFGWGIVGPVRVARATDVRERALILHESIRSRLVTSLIAVPVAAVATYLVCGPSYRWESVFVAVAMTLGGLTPAWFCIGQGNPRGLMWFDALPKLAASLLALPLVGLTGQVAWYPALLLAFTLPAFAIHARLTAHGDALGDARPRGLLTVLRTLVPTATIDATANAYGSTAIPIATAGLAASEASSFASADRAYRVAVMAVIACGNAFQAWVLDPADPDPLRRHRIAIVAHAGLGLVGGAALALLGPWATGLLFGEAVAAEPVPCLLFGVAFFFLSATTPLIRNVLIPAQRYRYVFIATLAAAAVGIVTMITGSSLGSPSIVALGVAASEATSFAVLVGPGIGMLIALARERDVSPPAAPTT